MWPSKKGPDIILLSSPIVPFKSWFETPKHVSVPDFVHDYLKSEACGRTPLASGATEEDLRCQPGWTR